MATLAAGQLIMTEEEMKRTLRRIVGEILERNAKVLENVIFFGILTRGFPLAQRLVQYIKEFEGIEIPVASLNIGLNRDDIVLRPNPHAFPTGLPLVVQGKIVVIADDVFYTARTARAAMNVVFESGRPEGIQLMALIDRGHQEMPIRADYVGRDVSASSKERVSVRLSETDGKDEVVILSS